MKVLEASKAPRELRLGVCLVLGQGVLDDRVIKQQRQRSSLIEIHAVQCLCVYTVCSTSACCFISVDWMSGMFLHECQHGTLGCEQEDI